MSARPPDDIDYALAKSYGARAATAKKSEDPGTVPDLNSRNLKGAHLFDSVMPILK